MDNDAHGLFKEPMTPAEAWLGTFPGLRDREVFPDGTLNGKQLQHILQLDDARYGRVQSTGHGADRPIVKLTEEIVEIYLSVGRTYTDRRSVVLWLNEKGKQIASAVWIGTKHDDSTVESYWVLPEDLDWKKLNYKPITKQHQYGMWSLGLDGAVPLTRKFIKDNYVDKEVSA
jgi:hypothetical protein